MPHPQETLSLEESIKAEAKRLGFPFCGICKPDPPAHYDAFINWLEQGHHADMHYLANDHSRQMRADPKQLLPNCKSILCLATPYPCPDDDRHDPEQGVIASYAWGKDYHLVIPERLEQLVEFIKRAIDTEIHAKICVDTSPLLEKDYAQGAGLGWIGRNSCLVIPGFGSHFFLSEILVDISLLPDEPYLTDGCMGCRRCVDACPTQAILPNCSIDSRRCISYLTIENRSTVPEFLRASIANRIFGCDTCQQVCPHNQSPQKTIGIHEILQPQIATHPRLQSELMLSKKQFEETYRNSPVLRSKYPGFMRNLLIALGNHPTPELAEILKELERWLDSKSYPSYNLSALIDRVSSKDKK